VYRWNRFNPYDISFGPAGTNNPAFFMGIPASSWAGGNVFAANISSDKETLRSFFTLKGYPGKNAMVYSSTRYGYSNPVDSEVVAVLFRIKNTSGVTIPWTNFIAASSDGGFAEPTSCAVNGSTVFAQTGAAPTSNYAFTVGVPPTGISTLVCIAQAGPISTGNGSSYLRTLFLGWNNNSLALPAGLQFVDDLETATGGWGQ